MNIYFGLVYELIKLKIIKSYSSIEKKIKLNKNKNLDNLAIICP